MKKIIIVSGILVTLITGLTFAFIIVSNNVRNNRDTLAITAAKISSDEKNIAHMITISNLIKNNAQDITRIQHIAIDPYRPLPFIEAIEEIGRSTNVKITLTVNEKIEGTPSLLFHATLQGNEKNVRAMLTLIQQLPYQINIETISFQRDVPIGFNSKQSVLPTLTRLILAIRVTTQ